MAIEKSWDGSYLLSYFPCHWHSLKLPSPSFCLWSFPRIMIRLWKSANEVMTLCEINVSCWWQHRDPDLLSPPHLFFLRFKLISSDICTRALSLWTRADTDTASRSNCHWQQYQAVLQFRAHILLDTKSSTDFLDVSLISRNHFFSHNSQVENSCFPTCNIYDVMTIINVQLDFHKTQVFSRIIILKGRNKSWFVETLQKDVRAGVFSVLPW